MISKNELVAEFFNEIKKSDRNDTFKGIYLAADWMKKLSFENRKTIFKYFYDEFNEKGDNWEKSDILMVLKLVGGNDSLKLINKVLDDGKTFHGESAIMYAEQAKENLKEYFIDEFISDLNLIINELQNLLSEENKNKIYQNNLKLLINELKILHDMAVNNKLPSKNLRDVYQIERFIYELFKYGSSIRKKLSKLLKNYKKVEEK